LHFAVPIAPAVGVAFAARSFPHGTEQHDQDATCDTITIILQCFLLRIDLSRQHDCSISWQ